MKLTLGQIRHYLFYLLIFSLPWQTRWIIRDPFFGGEPWEYGRISLYGWDILLVILLILCWPLLRSKLKEGLPANWYLFIFLMLWAFISILWSGDKSLSFTWALRFLEGGVFILLIKILAVDRFKVAWAFIWAGVIQALWAIIQFLTQNSFANKWLGVAVHPLTQGGTSVVMNEYGRWLRAYAGQVHPNVLGGLLVITLLATAYLYVSKKSPLQNPNAKLNPNGQNSKNNSYSTLLIILYIIQLVGLFFTFSRGAWLALFISFIFWWWRGRANRQQIMVVVLLSSATIVLMALVYWQPLSGRFTGQSTLEQQSIEDRRGSIKESGQILSSQWLLGTGIGNYTWALEEARPGLPAWRYQSVHNIYLLIFSELGIVGLLAFLWILFKLIKSSHQGENYLLFVIPILFISLFDHYWWTVPSMFLLLILILFPQPSAANKNP